MSDELSGDGIALWRHDIDFSPQRALALARIEAELGLTATYYVLLGSAFYNPFEVAVRDALRSIAKLGHDLGLHYDVEANRHHAGNHDLQIGFEAEMLEKLLDTPVVSFSIHNPDVVPDVSLDVRQKGALINATATALRTEFTYCSDSNGYWRYRSLHEVVRDRSVGRLYALTHAEWWTPEAMLPGARVRAASAGGRRG